MLRENITGFKKAVEVGIEIQLSFPEIANDYRDGLSQEEIVKKYRLDLEYNISEAIARRAVGFAIRGAKRYDQLRIPPYRGIIESEFELERLGLEHSIEGSRKVGIRNKTLERGIFSISESQRKKNSGLGGTRTYEKKSGIFGRSPEQRHQDSIKGGSIAGRRIYELGLGIHGRTIEQRRRDSHNSGTKAYKMGVGIHAQTPEERRRAALMGGTAATKLRGQTLWKNEELDFIREKLVSKEYKIKSGLNKNKIKVVLIKEELNERFYDGNQVRTNSAVYNVVHRLRKKMGLGKDA